MANDTCRELSEIVDWLVSLNESIWRCEKRIFKPNLSGKPFEVNHQVVERPLTAGEYERFKKITPHFVVFPHNAEMGFNFGITLYRPVEKKGEPLEQIITVVGHHLPEGMNRLVEGAWDALSPFSHNDSNIAKLREYDFPEVGDKHRYTVY